MSKYRISKVQFKEHVQVGRSSVPEKFIEPGKKAYDSVHVTCSYDGKSLRIDYLGRDFFTLVPNENIASLMMEPVPESDTTQKGR